MIEIRELLFRYPASGFGLRVPELQIADTSRVALVGPSGCGKTTLLSLLAGIYSPDAGVLRVGDVQVASLSDASRRAFRISSVGMVFQEFELLEYLNVEENILLPFSLNPELKLNHEGRESARSLAGSLGLDDLIKRRIDRLSQGERQRVAICRALVTNPKLILADEPTGNIDPSQSREILELLFRHVAASRSTLLMATHDHALLDSFDRVIDFSKPASAGIELLTGSSS
jgi:putative ABC transport system ATP-binding protein